MLALEARTASVRDGGGSEGITIGVDATIFVFAANKVSKSDCWPALRIRVQPWMGSDETPTSHGGRKRPEERLVVIRSHEDHFASRSLNSRAERVLCSIKAVAVRSTRSQCTVRRFLVRMPAHRRSASTSSSLPEAYPAMSAAFS